MKGMFVGALALICAFMCATLSTSNQVTTEYSRTIRNASEVAVMPKNSSCEQLNLYNGSVEFASTDIEPLGIALTF